MKSHITTIIIASVVGYFAGYLAQIKSSPSLVETNSHHAGNYSTENQFNPFQVEPQTNDLANSFATLQIKVESLQQQLSALEDQQSKIQSDLKKSAEASTPKKPTRITPNQQSLIASGINPDMADDILRRISQQDFRRLELQNLIQRSGPRERSEYSKELRKISRNKISLRSEMGDDSYDQYLFISGQNNRVMVSSVMAGSPAESSGFQTGDIILSYDNQKILNWTDIRSATIQGDIGSYTSIEILRDGAQINLTIPRGTLGVQLESTQLKP